MNNGVFILNNYQKKYLKNKASNKYSIIYYFIAGILLVIGLTSLLNLIDHKLTETNFSIFSKMKDLVAHSAYAETKNVYNDRSFYYSSNMGFFKNAASNKTSAVKTTNTKSTVAYKASTSTVKKTTAATTKSTVKSSVTAKATTKTATTAKTSITLPTKTVSTSAVATKTTSSTTNASLVAFKMIQSETAPQIVVGESKNFIIGFKNNGTSVWKPSSINVKLATATKSNFYNKSWIKTTIPTTLSLQTKPGEIGYFVLNLTAPAKKGTYAENYALYDTAGQKVSSSDFKITVNAIAKPVVIASKTTTTIKTSTVSQPTNSLNVVVKEAVTVKDSDSNEKGIDSNATTTNTTTVATQTPVVSNIASTGVITKIAGPEPYIRVGFTSTTDPVVLTANKAFDIRDKNNNTISTESANSEIKVVFDFSKKIYNLTTPKVSLSTDSYLRFIAAGTDTNQPDQDIIFEIKSYSHRPSWNTSYNDNKFRAAIEVRQGVSGKLWLINDLLVENYLKGLGETSNGSPYEYQKALLVAARTYANYHIANPTKYKGENFLVRNTDADQVYNGYGSEVRMPNLVKAINETRGQIVTYAGKLAITPYFSQSDGRTRSWEEVWGGGSKPWLVGKEDPYCKGKPKLGHGVGLSAIGALNMAADGQTYDIILKYYYTGIDLTRIYQ